MTPKERYDFICELRRNGATLQHIANRLGVSRQAIEHVVNGRQRVSGRPCPRCHGSSRVLRTFPPTLEHTKRSHRCKHCGHEWMSYQRDGQ